MWHGANHAHSPGVRPALGRWAGPGELHLSEVSSQILGSLPRTPTLGGKRGINCVLGAQQPKAKWLSGGHEERKQGIKSAGTRLEPEPSAEIINTIATEKDTPYSDTNHAQAYGRGACWQ